MPDRPAGPQGPARPHALPMGIVPSASTEAFFHVSSSYACPPSPPPCNPQMPARPHNVPAMPGMPLPDDLRDYDSKTRAVQAKTKAMAATAFAPARPSEEAGGNKHPFLVILSKQQALDIYSMRSPTTTNDTTLQAVAGKSSMVAEMYGVSPKTIRDIWNRKTWAQVTRGLWTQEEADEYALEQAQAKLPPAERQAIKAEMRKRRGRPPGSKDSRPRRRRVKGSDGSEHLGPSEGVMYVTIDGAVQVKPIPQAPKVSDIPEVPSRNVARPAISLSDFAPPAPQAAPAPAPALPVRPSAPAAMHSRPESEPMPEPGQYDDFFWTEENAEPGVADDEEEPECPHSGEDDSETRPKALMGPIGDDFFEQPCFRGLTAAEFAGLPGFGAGMSFAAPPSPLQQPLAPASGSRPLKKCKKEAGDDAHNQLLSIMASANNSRESSPALDWISWLPDGYEQQQTQQQQTQQPEAPKEPPQAVCAPAAATQEPCAPSCGWDDDSSGPAGPTPARLHTTAPGGTVCQLAESILCGMSSSFGDAMHGDHGDAFMSFLDEKRGRSPANDHGHGLHSHNAHHHHAIDVQNAEPGTTDSELWYFGA
mmetsp:Transcript_19614/g.48132  ORF Transcript_19614/g.48132 Transcript_19614/m.48132 type:complete len:592 (+) Transcript_19614:318-2093(+)